MGRLTEEGLGDYPGPTDAYEIDTPIWLDGGIVYTDAYGDMTEAAWRQKWTEMTERERDRFRKPDPPREASDARG